MIQSTQTTKNKNKSRRRCCCIRRIILYWACFEHSPHRGLHPQPYCLNSRSGETDGQAKYCQCMRCQALLCGRSPRAHAGIGVASRRKQLTIYCHSLSLPRMAQTELLVVWFWQGYARLSAKGSLHVRLGARMCLLSTKPSVQLMHCIPAQP